VDVSKCVDIIRFALFIVTAESLIEIVVVVVVEEEGGDGSFILTSMFESIDSLISAIFFFIIKFL